MILLAFALANKFSKLYSKLKELKNFFRAIEFSYPSPIECKRALKPSLTSDFFCGSPYCWHVTFSGNLEQRNMNVIMKLSLCTNEKIKQCLSSFHSISPH